MNWSQVENALIAIPARADAAEQATADLRSAVSSIQSNADRSQAWKADAIQKAKDSTTARLQQLRTEIRAAVDTIDLNRPAALGSDDPLAELKLARAWARVEKMLEGGVPLKTIVDAAISNQDALTIMALRDEMPARITIEAQGMPPMDVAGAVELNRRYLATSVATGFPSTEEGRWLGAKLQADLLSQIAHILIDVGLGDVLDRPRTMEDAVALKLLKKDLADLRSKLPAGSAA